MLNQSLFSTFLNLKIIPILGLTFKIVLKVTNICVCPLLSLLHSLLVLPQPQGLWTTFNQMTEFCFVVILGYLQKQGSANVFCEGPNITSKQCWLCRPHGPRHHHPAPPSSRTSNHGGHGCVHWNVVYKSRQRAGSGHLAALRWPPSWSTLYWGKTT